MLRVVVVIVVVVVVVVVVIVVVVVVIVVVVVAVAGDPALHTFCSQLIRLNQCPSMSSLPFWFLLTYSSRKLLKSWLA